MEDGVAHITVKRKDNALKRHIYKTITYRVMASVVTVLVAKSLGASTQVASLIGVGEILLKPLIYFGHERLWYVFGKTSR